MTDETIRVQPDAGMPADACPVLVLQGGGALGSYQVGAFEALCECNFAPQWVAGISIGAINAALIAGNTPENRHQRLSAFWDRMSSQATWPAVPWLSGEGSRTAVTEWNAGVIMLAGVPGFFKPRFPPLPFQSADDLTALSFYDTEPLRETLKEMVDFDLINSKEGVRISVGAVNVATGAQMYFDNKGDMPTVIGPEHIMASAALPPGFPAVRIGDDYFWDGGLISNTPLDHVLKHKGQDNLLVFQLDLFSAAGVLPTSLGEIAEREKDIRFASRTEINTKKNRTLYNAGQLPPSGRSVAGTESPVAPSEGMVTVVHLTYHSALPEVASRDYNFSPLAVAEHRRAGRRDIERAMRDQDWLRLPQNDEPMAVYVLTQDDKDPLKRA
ncbi:patatin-like phospholipase family protein [uncultured Bradyrhizobium sp.]|uniref:patatin-like phospholipase family protein n=1 Tax=uncultured Bradyrhizobium sp. TaxID=199684 RepID=UPI0035CB50EB